ncbi:MAG: tetratricopeptide repeat protein, partial [Pseudomonadales bacterium]
EASDSSFELWVDSGPWLVYPLLIFALLAFQRGRLAVLLFVPSLVLVTNAPAEAAEAPWYLNDDQAGLHALRRGSPEAALARFEDPRWRATALYRNQEFDAAAAAFAAFDDPFGHYNRGNALAKGGHYEAALQAYDQALAQNPTLEDAVKNRDLVQQLLDRAKAASQNEQGKQKDQPEPGDSDAEAGNNSEESGQEAPPEEPGDSGRRRGSRLWRRRQRWRPGGHSRRRRDPGRTNCRGRPGGGGSRAGPRTMAPPRARRTGRPP